MTPESAEVRVARGLPRLVQGCPRWWDRRNGEPGVEPLLLDLTDPRHGLLAAIYGSHDIGLHLLGIEAGEAIYYGFVAVDEADNIALRRLWAIHANSARAEADSPSPPH